MPLRAQPTFLSLRAVTPRTSRSRRLGHSGAVSGQSLPGALVMGRWARLGPGGPLDRLLQQDRASGAGSKRNGGFGGQFPNDGDLNLLSKESSFDSIRPIRWAQTGRESLGKHRSPVGKRGETLWGFILQQPLLVAPSAPPSLGVPPARHQHGGCRGASGAGVSSSPLPSFPQRPAPVTGSPLLCF